MKLHNIKLTGNVFRIFHNIKKPKFKLLSTSICRGNAES